MLDHATMLGAKVGDTLAFPLIEDAYRITRRASAPTAWFLLYIDPTERLADRVERFVARKGFATYCPRQREVLTVEVRRNGAGLKRNAKGRPIEQRVRTNPLLPRYMPVAMPASGTPFIALDGPEARMHGIVGFIARDHVPVVIPDADIAELRDRDAAGEWDATVKKGRKLVAKDPDWATAGRTVRVKEGPFAFFNAVIERHLGRGAVQARIHLFGQETPVRISLDEIEALAAV